MVMSEAAKLELEIMEKAQQLKRCGTSIKILKATREIHMKHIA